MFIIWNTRNTTQSPKDPSTYERPIRMTIINRKIKYCVKLIMTIHQCLIFKPSTKTNNFDFSSRFLSFKIAKIERIVQTIIIMIENTILIHRREIWEAFDKSQCLFEAKYPIFRVSVDIKFKKFSSQYQIKKFHKMTFIK